jgi:hypothetical protein
MTLPPTPSGRTPIPARVVVPKGTSFQTFKNNVKLSQGQKLGFQPGKGYYAKGQPVGQGEAKNQTPFTRPTATPKRKSVPAGLPSSPPKAGGQVLSPAQQSANAALGPLYAQQSQEAAAQNAAIKNYTTAIMAALGGVPGQVANDYNQAIGQTTNLANAAADSLRAANPNTQDQALLSAIGAPQEQHDAIANQLGQVFNGGAAVGQYLNGVLPANSLQGQKLTATTLARLQPGFEGLRGAQALAGALLQQREARAKIDAQRPDLIYKYETAQASQNAKNQQLALERQALGLKTQNQSFTQGATKVRLSQADQRIANQQTEWLANQKRQVAQFNARQTTADAKLGLPSNSLSRTRGYLVDSRGNAILGSNGKKQVLPGFKTNAKGRVVPTTGKGKSSAKTLTPNQVQKYRNSAQSIAANAKYGFTAKDGTKHPPLTPYGAWQELMKDGVPVKYAVEAINRAYKTNFRPSKNLP